MIISDWDSCLVPIKVVLWKYGANEQMQNIKTKKKLWEYIKMSQLKYINSVSKTKLLYLRFQDEMQELQFNLGNAQNAIKSSKWIELESTTKIFLK